MSAVTTGPFPIAPLAANAAGLAIQLSLPQQSPQQAVVISNLSPYDCKVTVAGQQYWLPQFMENVYPLPTNRDQVTVQPNGGPANSTQAGRILATWYAPGDVVPGGTWPVSLTAQAIAAGFASLSSFGEPNGVQFTSATVAAAGNANLLALGTFNIYNLGFAKSGGTYPTLGSGDLEFEAAVGGTSAELLDVVNPASPASSRAAGIMITGAAPLAASLVAINTMDQPVFAYAFYLPG